jgi:DNA-binding CsgD family transcriptional regulator
MDTVRDRRSGNGTDYIWHSHVLEQALSHLGQGIIVLSNTGNVLFMTDVAKRMINQQDGLKLENNHLVAESQADNERLQAMLTTVLADTKQSGYQQFYIHRQQSHRPYLIQISIIHEPELQETSILMVLKDTHANTLYWQARLKKQHQLTNREADFVVLMTEGRSVKEIGQVMDIAEDTARQYLKNCFKKMGVQKQHEMVCLALDYARKR